MTAIEENDSDRSVISSWVRQLSDVAPGLQRWAEDRFGPKSEIVDIQLPDTGGASADIALFSLAWPGHGPRDLAARLSPASEDQALFNSFTIETQVAVIDLVRSRTDAPVPSIFAHERDRTYVGTDFFVMERIDGRPPPPGAAYCASGWVADATDAQRAAIDTAAVNLLAEIHTVNPDNADLSFLEPTDLRGQALLKRQLQRQREFYDWSRRGLRSSLIERLFDFLEQDVPELPDVLCWGDSRIGNVLWNNRKPVAVLDWEMAVVSPREADLGWMIFFHSYGQAEMSRVGASGLPAFQQRSTLAAEYERLTGYRPQRLDWFEVYGALKFAIIMVRIFLRVANTGKIPTPQDLNDFVPYAELIESMLDGSYS